MTTRFLSPRSTGLVVLVVLILAAAARAQCSEGPFAGVPAATIVHNEPNLRADQMYLKVPGFGKRPARWPASSLPSARPNFDMSKVLGGIPGLTVDAISLGDDWVLGDCSGNAVVPQSRWAAVTLSVTKATRGSGGAIRAEAAAGSPGADIFSYVLPGSALPAKLVGVTQRALDASEMALAPGADVAAFDLFIPYHSRGDRIANVFPAGMMPMATQVFFSLTNRSLAKAPAAWFGTAGPSGATVLVSTWDPAKRKWATPGPWRTYQDLRLEQQEDVDALAIDLDSQQMLLSTDIAIIQRDPILFLSWQPGCRSAGVVTYRAPVSGKSVSEEIGLVPPTDDVDAICAMDPSAKVRTGAATRLNSARYGHGTPAAPTGVFGGRPLSGSAFRDYDWATSQVVFHTYLVGWPSGRPAAGAAGVLVTLAGSLSPSSLVGINMRNTANLFCGDPVAGALYIPPLPALNGVELALRWFAADSARIAEAYPVRIKI